MKYIFYVFLFIYVFGFSQNRTYSVINLSLNNEKPHFGLTFNKANEVLFTSYLLNKKGRVKLSFSGAGILSLYKGNTTENGEIINIEPLFIDKNEDILNITNASFSPDGKNLFVTTTYDSRANKPKGDFKNTNFHLEIAEYKNGIGWTNFKVLPFCDPKYSYAHPFVSPDGKTLYFIANIRGGKQTTKGASDVFKVEILGDNKYGEPINLGSNVNSYSKEMFPSIGADNTLYFASNKPGGFGGFDIYKCTMNVDGTYNKSEKLPKPINSKRDDFCFVIDAANKAGYFTSKRHGTKGDDDIYYFTVE
ncbi:hypothetical protein APS56_15225 [Pseudalgibacter alginicilyticus]|uniref:Uncharacterized protein n=2 Tax=Pseudalgibacter alginicilyticus TaxID=1736674 RepID=A0A0P0DE30_9FLAO|nr:hypothetical protein APS56_15225 [Pseudalgibacter alginicilyticus]